MRAVVLVGGEGTRLRPLTYTLPKQMLPVAGTTMIERVLAHLARHGVDDVVLSLGYRPDAFLAAFPEGRAAGVRLTYAVESEPRDTGGAIGFAAREAGITETFLAVNGDVLTDLDISALVAFHVRNQAEATISLTPVEDPSPFGVVPTTAEGRVEAFIEKPPRETAPTNLINAGTYVLEPGVVDLIAAEGRVSVEKETFPCLVGRGSLYALASDAYWIDTGTPAQYIRATLDIVAGRRQDTGPPRPGVVGSPAGGWVHPGAHVEGRVEPPALVEEGARIDAGAVVADSVVGAGAHIAARATVTGSVVLGGARVGPGTVVDGSVVGPGAEVGENARLGPTTVLGAGAHVPAGAELADARVPS